MEFTYPSVLRSWELSPPWYIAPGAGFDQGPNSENTEA